MKPSFSGRVKPSFLDRVYTSVMGSSASLALGLPIVAGMSLSVVSLEVRSNEELPVFMYRYTDQKGRSVVSQQVPPEAYVHGYEALGEDGNVLYKVDPPPTDEERAEYEREKKYKKRAEELKLQDQALLKTYSSPDDAVRTKERKLQQLNVTIEITEAKINQSRLQYEHLLNQAADLEKRGRDIDAGILANMDSLEAQIQDLEGFIDNKNKEKQRIIEDYDLLAERLKKLMAQ